MAPRPSLRHGGKPGRAWWASRTDPTAPPLDRVLAPYRGEKPSYEGILRQGRKLAKSIPSGRARPGQGGRRRTGPGRISDRHIGIDRRVAITCNNSITQGTL